jgi:PPOX class probable F420-dependent enzyme
MDTSERDSFLAKPQTAILATVDARGRPHAVPVWYLYKDGVFQIFTGRDSAKVHNIRATGRAALAVDQREGAVRHVTAEGTVAIREQITREERFALHLHYRGEEAARQLVEASDEHEQMVILRLRPERWY